MLVPLAMVACIAGPPRRSAFSAADTVRHARLPVPAPRCDVWLEKTVKGTSRLGEKKWRDWIIAAVPGACVAVPQQLRQAAADASRAKAPTARAATLAAAATRILGPACAVPEPLESASKLALACPFPLGLKMDPASTQMVRAVDYALIAALIKSFADAGEYGEPAKTLIAHFTLSATLLGEETIERERRKTRDMR